jgi:DNA modification methylase
VTGAAAGGAAPYYRSPSGDVVLYQGDAAAVLRALPAGSVHCCICSPPYWKLRDYQTATWEGGGAGCTHQGPPMRTNNKPTDHARSFHGGETRANEFYRAVCGRCGARRVDAQLGLEATPDAYVAALVAVFREVWRVLRDDGTLWLNLGDSYAAHGRMVTDAPPHKDRAAASARYKNGPSVGRVAGFPRKGLMMIPPRVAIALQDDGWLLRAMIPWLKANSMPDSATDRPGVSTEYVFLLSKAGRYFYDAKAVALPASPDAAAKHPHGRRKMSAWKEAEDGSGIKSNGSFRDATAGVVSSRNRRNADWWFDSLRAILAGATGLLADEDGAPLALPVNPQPFPGSHFAVFPERLVEPMLLASTSARGACGKCGAPWVRTTEASYTPHPAGGHVGFAARGDAGGMKDLSAMPRLTKHVETTGWRAGCGCEDAGEPVPCVCLDPFAGAGTVGVVARKHGRHSVLIELSETYCAMARDRLGQMALPLGPLT